MRNRLCRLFHDRCVKTIVAIKRTPDALRWRLEVSERLGAAMAAHNSSGTPRSAFRTHVSCRRESMRFCKSLGFAKSYT